MKKQKLTPWFPAGTKPARVGVYQCGEMYSRQTYQFWHGAFWSCWCWSVEDAARYGVQSQRQNSTWRGLAVKP